MMNNKAIFAISEPIRDERWVKLALWMFLKKLKVIGIKKERIHHIMSLTPGVTQKIPKGAIDLDVISTAVEFLVPCDRSESNWPP